MPNFTEQSNFDDKVPSLPEYNIGWLHRFNEALQAVVNRTRYLLENGSGASVEIVNNLTTSDPNKALSAEMGVFIAQYIGDAITELALKAPLISPVFTGNPAAPTQTQGTNDSKLATTQFVNDAVYNAINALISSAPENLNQLNELAAALNNDPDFATTVLNAVANKLAIDVIMTLTTQQKNNVFVSLGLGSMANANASNYLSVANSRYQFVADTGTTYTVPASAVTENGRTIIELSNNSLTSITVDTNTGAGKTSGDSVHISITGTYAGQALVASGVTLEGDLTFSCQYQTKTLVYKGSDVWKVVG